MRPLTAVVGHTRAWNWPGIKANRRDVGNFLQIVEDAVGKAAAMNPAALQAAEVAQLFIAAGAKVSEADVQRDIDDGAPTNGDGTINLLHYTAWLAQETKPKK